MLSDDDKTWIADRIAASEERLNAKITASEQRVTESLTEVMRDIQSETLRGFEPYQRQMDLRDAAIEARLNAAEGRLATVQTRLAEIEKKLLLNPPAA